MDLIFDNRKMIDLLTQRGQAIQTENISKSKELERKIDVYKE